MKGSGILHSEISQLVAALGHGDKIAISDYGLPCPEGVRQIDLAISPGTPDFLTVLETIWSELCVEQSFLATELRETNPAYLQRVRSIVTKPTQFVPHETFKAQLREVKAIVRTGEWTPYANVILQAGVPF